jgi:hypothetical protein
VNGVVILQATPAGTSGFRQGLANSTWLRKLELVHGEAYSASLQEFVVDLSEDRAGHFVTVGEFEDTTELKPRQTILRTTISSLPGEPYTLLQPIPLKIDQVGEGDFLAGFDEANIAMSGETSQEAFQNLIAEILNAFESFSVEEANLGPEPARQLRILKKYLAPQQ